MLNFGLASDSPTYDRANEFMVSCLQCFAILRDCDKMHAEWIFRYILRQKCPTIGIFSKVMKSAVGIGPQKVNLHTSMNFSIVLDKNSALVRYL